MCVCVWLGVVYEVMGVGGAGGLVELIRGLGLGFTNPVGKGGVLDVCLFELRWCRW